MNSLNILSARVSPPQTPAPSRTNSYGAALSLASSKDAQRQPGEDDTVNEVVEGDHDDIPPDLPAVWQAEELPHEKTPLLDSDDDDEISKSYSWILAPNRIASAFVYSLKWVLSTLISPGVYLFRLFYDGSGSFAPLRFFTRNSSSSARAQQLVEADRKPASNGPGRRGSLNQRTSNLSATTSSVMLSGSESEKERSASESGMDGRSSSRHTRSKSLQTGDEIAPARRSIRIKLHNDDSLRKRKHQKSQSTNSQSNGSGGLLAAELTAATLKSPTSPAAALSLTKYPRAPAPPRPLIPARMPSFTFDPTVTHRARKTLILDLDETLIHSMAKGGRMSSGHMVEVKLNTYIGVAGQASVGPQHPILYYVHKRPYCDDFLRRVSPP